jgi:hypothetical protein
MRRAIDRLREVSGRPRLRRLASSLLAMALAGCGGGNEAEPRARAFVAVMATATDTAPALADNRAQRLAATIAPVIFTADDWFAWAEKTYPELFPVGPQTQAVLFQSRNYQVRYYPQHDVHLGVSADGQVYALGAFTQHQLVQYGQLTNYACITNPASCLGSVEDTVSVWNWAGTQQCQPNDFPARLAALRQMSLAVTAELAAGQNPAWAASCVKDLGAVFEQDIPEIAQAILDEAPAVGGGSDHAQVLAALMQMAPSFSLRGGTREVLRGIIARGLGLR